MDTIIALSSGSLPAGVAVIRLSGPAAFDAVRPFLSANAKRPDRQLRLATLFDPTDKTPLDEALVCGFAGPASFTGEDIVELHVHGSRAVVARILDILAGRSNVRLAEPGEFTHRAFLNGKMDLTGAEGLAELIDAETEAQRKLAFAIQAGGLRELYTDWRSTLLGCRAMLEADIDFADEDDVPGSVVDQVWPRVRQLVDAMRTHIAEAGRGQQIRDGFHVVIAGAPNAGKSSLLNAMAGRDVAIVTDQAGTTRDVIEVRLNLGGFLVRLSDTAGIRDTEDKIEQEGVRRAQAALAEADLVLHLSESGTFEPLETAANIVRVYTKADLRGSPGMHSDFDLQLSVRDNGSVGALLALLTKHVHERIGAVDMKAYANQRHAAAVRDAIELLDPLSAGEALEISAERLRAAADVLGGLVGAIGVEDVLGEIFSSFCIGK